MNKKHQAKLEDIEREIDSHQAAIIPLIAARDYLRKKTKKPTKRAVKIVTDKNKKIIDDWVKPMYESRGYKDWDEIGVDNDLGIDVPLHARGGHFTWNFEEKKSSFFDRNADKITWVLTAVNVAIFITLLIKNLN